MKIMRFLVTDTESPISTKDKTLWLSNFVSVISLFSDDVFCRLQCFHLINYCKFCPKLIKIVTLEINNEKLLWLNEKKLKTKYFILLRVTQSRLTHSFPMYPFSTQWKYQKNVRFWSVTTRTLYSQICR